MTERDKRSARPTRRDQDQRSQKRSAAPIRKDRDPKRSNPARSGSSFGKPNLLRRDLEPKRRSSWPTPEIPEGITGEELDRKNRFQLEQLAEENRKRVAQHLVALDNLLETDAEQAFLHGQAAAFRAGRIAYVRERAGIAALRFGKFDVAQKDLKAAQRISGSDEILPYIAQCEVALGNPRKALEISGRVKAAKLSDLLQVELRIAAARARIALGQDDAAIVTLTCKELNRTDASWSKRLHHEYANALTSAGRISDVDSFKLKYPHSFEVNE